MGGISHHGYELEPSIKSVLGSNIKFLRLKNKITQEELANRLNIPKTTLSGYERGASIPCLALTAYMAKYFNINLETFIHINLNNASTFVGNNSAVDYGYNNDEYKRFIGLPFWIYHYRTSTQHINELNIGILEFKFDIERQVYIAEALFNEAGYHYGYLTLSNKHINIYLNSTQGSRSLIVLNNPESYKKYYGGIGLIVSTSEGREKSYPCVHRILLTNIHLPDNKINGLKNYLSMEAPMDNVYKIDKSLDKDFYKFITN